MPFAISLNNEKQKSIIMHELYNKTGHAGRESTYTKVAI